MKRHQCTCTECKQQPEGATAQKHHQLNFLLTTLNERQRRMLAAYEADQLGDGGDAKIAKITG